MRGKLTSIITSTATTGPGGSPVFSQTLMYANGKTPLYDGRISSRKWSQGTAVPHRYDYTYGFNGFLMKADYSGGAAGSDYSTSYTYDLRGNITSVRRKGIIDLPPSGMAVYGLLDDITAAYSAYKLTSLSVESDAETFAARTGMRTEGTFGMEYDFAGCLTYDASRDIRSISYDSDGRILGMEVGDNGNYSYYRDGSGNLLSSTIYVRTADNLGRIVKHREYTGNGHIIVDDSLKMTRFPGGYFTPDGGVFYYISDYQGNICKVVDKAGRVYQTMDYYPYGEPFREWYWDLAERNSSMSSNRYLYSGNERETGLGVNKYDFQARDYVASFPRFGRPDPKSTKYAGISPYSFCAGDPINHTDPNGCEVVGESKNDAKLAVEDFKAMFPGDKFESFRNLFTIYKNNDNKYALKYISMGDRQDALGGVSLSEDQNALVDMVMNTINSKDVHKIEYVGSDKYLSSHSESELVSHMPSAVYLRDNTGRIQVATAQEIRGDGFTISKENGSYSVVFMNPIDYPYKRAVITGHEIIGHGRSLSLNRGELSVHVDAIQTENLIRRMMDIPEPNTGVKHGDGVNKGYFPEYNHLPSFR